MNFNAVIATLVIKGVITEEEGNALVNFLHDKPQSSQLTDSIREVEEFMTYPPLTGGPQQQAEELAARERAAEEQRKRDAGASEVEATTGEATPEEPAEEPAPEETEKKPSKKQY